MIEYILCGLPRHEETISKLISQTITSEMNLILIDWVFRRYRFALMFIKIFYRIQLDNNCKQDENV